MIRLALLWNLSLLLLPILLGQAFWARKKTIRLPEASGPRLVEHDTGVSILGIGESTIAGVGVERMDQSLTARVASVLEAKLGEKVSWFAFGQNGDRLEDLVKKSGSLPDREFSAVFVAIGVNDVTGLTSLLRWSQQIVDLTMSLREHYNAPVFYSAVPPMHFFTALPQPLRAVLGIRARMLDRVLQQMASAGPGVYHLAADFPLDTSQLAADGFHPSEKGYEIWGLQIADEIFAVLEGR